MSPAMLVPRSSTMTGCPRFSDSPGAIRRETISLALPVSEVTMRMGLVGLSFPDAASIPVPVRHADHIHAITCADRIPKAPVVHLFKGTSYSGYESQPRRPVLRTRNKWPPPVVT